MSRTTRTNATARHALRVALAAVLMYVTVSAPLFSAVMSAEIIEIVEKSVVPVVVAREPALDARVVQMAPTHDLHPVRLHPEAPPTPPPEA